MSARLKAIAWALLRRWHHLDFAHLLPTLARLPLAVAWPLARARAGLQARTRFDWRSIALGYRHIERQTVAGYALLPLASTEARRDAWCRERFAVEAREEFEAHLVMAGRAGELRCRFSGEPTTPIRPGRERGLVLLTPHYDSFFLGIAFLERFGARMSPMSSGVTGDPRVEPAVSRYYRLKYEALARHLNGGRVLEMEQGVKPFYKLLNQGEVVIVLADAPVLPQGASMNVDFLGARRVLAGGALRMAQHTDSDIGGFVCRHLCGGDYEVEMMPVGPAREPASIERVYAGFSRAILADPARWWACDLLPAMPPVSGPVTGQCVHEDPPTQARA